MSNSDSDTLDIRPIYPAALAGQGSDAVAAPDQTGQRSDNDPHAAAAARARIAALKHPADDTLGVLPVLPPGSAPPHSPSDNLKPVSPAAEQHRHSRPGAKISAHLPSRLKPVVSAVASFLLILAVFKSPVLISQVGYLFSDKPSVNEQIGETLPAAGAAVSAEPVITIPKINVKAPVVYEPSIQESQIQRALENGVVHYGNTPRPGQPGNSVIVGHSSNDWWEAGDYKFVFVLLDKLILGDTFSINYNGSQYVYEVTEIKIVKPTDLSVLAPTPNPTVTLITCSPPGFSTNRLIIRAKQTSPTPGQTQAAKPATPVSAAENTLPGNAPSFSDQLGQAWSAFSETIGGLFGGGGEDQEQPSPEGQPQTLPNAI